MKNLPLMAGLIASGILTGSSVTYLLTRDIPKVSDIGTPCIENPHCPNPYVMGMEWLDLDTALQRVSLYEKNQAQGINEFKDRQSAVLAPGKAPFSDTRFVTFPFDTVKRFMYNIDQMLIEFHPLGRDLLPIQSCDLGVRFYYSAYPNTDNFTLAEKERHSLILVPTYFDKVDNMYREFIPWYKDTRSVARSLTDLKSDPGSNHGRGVPIVTINLKNQGTLCPPPSCDEAIRKMASQ